MPDAQAFNAAVNNTLGSTTVPLNPPDEICAIPNTLFLLFSSRILNSSSKAIFPLSHCVYIKVLKASLDLLTCGLSETLNFGLYVISTSATFDNSDCKIVIQYWFILIMVTSTKLSTQLSKDGNGING